MICRVHAPRQQPPTFTESPVATSGSRRNVGIVAMLVVSLNVSMTRSNFQSSYLSPHDLSVSNPHRFQPAVTASSASWHASHRPCRIIVSLIARTGLGEFPSVIVKRLTLL